MADIILAVSKRHAEILLRHMPECRDRIRVLYNPLPDLPEVDKNLENIPTFLYCGGDSYVKGFYVLVETLKKLGERGQNNFKLILTNKYSQKSLSIIDRLKRRYNLDIEAHGLVERNELLKLYSRAWALLFPSIWEEPLPYIILEACLLKTIPIASRVGGIPEILKDTPAEKFIFKPHDTNDFLKKIKILLLMDKETLNKIGSELKRKIISRFSNDVTINNLASILMSAADRC